MPPPAPRRRTRRATTAASLRREPVARASRRFDHVATLAERLAQPLDVDVDRPLFDEYMVTPDLVQQLSPTVDPLGMRHEVVQQLEFRGAQLEQLPVPAGAMRRRIQRKAADGNGLVHALGG